MMSAARRKAKATKSTDTTNTSYILRGLDAQLWRMVKGKAALEGKTVKAAVEALLRQYVAQP